MSKANGMANALIGTRDSSGNAQEMLVNKIAADQELLEDVGKLLVDIDLDFAKALVVKFPVVGIWAKLWTPVLQEELANPDQLLKE
ncbi:hypothetical protein ACFLQI_01530 [Candidatus Undinarchaeota archaeon]